MRQANTTFVNLRAALDDLDPLVEHGEAGDQEPGPVPGRTAPGALQSGARLHEPAPDRRPARQGATTPPNCSASCRRCSERAAKAFPHAEEAIAGLPAEPQLRPRLHAGHLQRLRQARPGHRLLRRQRPLRAGPGRRPQPLRATTAAATSNRSRRASSSTPSAPRRRVRRPCPGGATQSAPDGSNPFVEPPFAGAGVSPLRMQPGRRAPGP